MRGGDDIRDGSSWSSIRQPVMRGAVHTRSKIRFYVSWLSPVTAATRWVQPIHYKPTLALVSGWIYCVCDRTWGGFRDDLFRLWLAMFATDSEMRWRRKYARVRFTYPYMNVFLRNMRAQRVQFIYRVHFCTWKNNSWKLWYSYFESTFLKVIHWLESKNWMGKAFQKQNRISQSKFGSVIVGSRNHPIRLVYSVILWL